MRIEIRLPHLAVGFILAFAVAVVITLALRQIVPPDLFLPSIWQLVLVFGGVYAVTSLITGKTSVAEAVVTIGLIITALIQVYAFYVYETPPVALSIAILAGYLAMLVAMFCSHRGWVRRWLRKLNEGYGSSD